MNTIRTTISIMVVFFTAVGLSIAQSPKPTVDLKSISATTWTGRVTLSTPAVGATLVVVKTELPGLVQLSGGQDISDSNTPHNAIGFILKNGETMGTFKVQVVGHVALLTNVNITATVGGVQSDPKVLPVEPDVDNPPPAALANSPGVGTGGNAPVTPDPGSTQLVAGASASNGTGGGSVNAGALLGM